MSFTPSASGDIPASRPTLTTTWDVGGALGATFDVNNGYLLRSTLGAGAGRGCGQFVAIPGGTTLVAGIILNVGTTTPYAWGGPAVHDGATVLVGGPAAGDVTLAPGRATFNFATGARTALAGTGGVVSNSYPIHIGVRDVAGSWYVTWSPNGYTWYTDVTALVITPTHYGIALNADGSGCQLSIGHLVAAADDAAYAALIPSWARP